MTRKFIEHAMTVKDLIQLLNKVEDKEMPVIIAKDSEGNGYSPLPKDNGHSFGTYVPDTFGTHISSYSGNIYSEDEEDLEGYKEEGDLSTGQLVNAVKAIILWPTN